MEIMFWRILQQASASHVCGLFRAPLSVLRSPGFAYSNQVLVLLSCASHFARGSVNPTQRLPDMEQINDRGEQRPYGGQVWNRLGK